MKESILCKSKSIVIITKQFQKLDSTKVSGSRTWHIYSWQYFKDAIIQPSWEAFVDNFKLAPLKPLHNERSETSNCEPVSFASKAKTN